MDFGSKDKDRHSHDIPETPEDGHHYPDQTIECMLTVLKQESKHLLQAYSEYGKACVSPPLSQLASRALLVEAFCALPDWLAAPLQAAVRNPSRWQLTRVSQEMVGGYCLPRHDALNEAVIVYRYGETPDDPIYMAHEVGHLVSDDLFNAAGFGFLAAPAHIVEIPAFFTQHLMYDYLIHHGPVHLRGAAAAHYRTEMREQLIDIAIGASARIAGAHSDQSAAEIEGRYRSSMQSWLGDDWVNCARAVQIADRIADPKIRSETETVFLHKHATSSILASALFARQKVMSKSARTELLATMFGANGPYTADHLLQIVGASRRPQLTALVLEATRIPQIWTKQAMGINGIGMPDVCPG